MIICKISSQFVKMNLKKIIYNNNLNQNKKNE